MASRFDWTALKLLYVLSSRAEDLGAGLIAAFEKFEQLPGDETLEAPSDLARALALSGASGGVSTGVGVVAESGHDDDMERAVALAIPGSGSHPPGPQMPPRNAAGRHTTSSPAPVRR